jgi:hypothetical protein
VVNDSGQIYTIEGLAAGVLMIVTAYLIVSTTTVFTPQDVHITDMQLEQMGNDALAMMDTPNELASDGSSEMSDLENYIASDNYTGFKQQFLGYVNETTGTSTDKFRINASLFYRDDTGVNSYAFGPGDAYYREDAVKVSRWIYLPNSVTSHPPYKREGNQSVLLEVLLWRE